ncbi:MAG TPA: hypothetical protein PLJ21_12400, partial [Pseudobdellovibrionaceae bacterium]|nr:hypothetical protein [Pseudobdellovibrionaceae bacterium]
MIIKKVKRLPSIKLIFLSFVMLLNSQLYASRPVYKQINRAQLIDQSQFIFSGWPSTQEPFFACKNEMGRWWVKKVLKGDKNLEGKVISLVDHQYRLATQKQTQQSLSFSVNRFKEGTLNKQQITSFLFTNKNPDGCFELSALGAQEPNSLEAEIVSIFENNCALLPNDKCTEGPKNNNLNSNSKFSKAIMRSACAPHDALSKMLILTNGKTDYPIFTLNWWGSSQPLLSGGTFT